MSLIRDLSTQVSKPVHLDDNEDLFGRSISADLRDLPHFERMMAKNEISAYNKQNPRQGFMAQVPLPSQSNLMNLNFAASANQNQGSEVSSRLSSPPSTPGSWSTVCTFETIFKTLASIVQVSILYIIKIKNIHMFKLNKLLLQILYREM